MAKKREYIADNERLPELGTNISQGTFESMIFLFPFGGICYFPGGVTFVEVVFFLRLSYWRGIYRTAHFINPSFKGIKYTFQEINVSHLGKGKIIFKMPFLGDIMLVPWRVTKLWGHCHKSKPQRKGFLTKKSFHFHLYNLVCWRGLAWWKPDLSNIKAWLMISGGFLMFSNFPFMVGRFVRSP